MHKTEFVDNNLKFTKQMTKKTNVQNLMTELELCTKFVSHNLVHKTEFVSHNLVHKTEFVSHNLVYETEFVNSNLKFAYEMTMEFND